MKALHRIIMVIASVILLGMYFVPLWVIDLEAPQYPEGLGLYIHLSSVVGQKESDLESINNLNHYIGMKRIEPDSIPELKYMPIIVGVIAGLGLLVALIGRRALVLSWVLLFTGLAIVGMVDFYNWEYDYGHNLNPHAAINIPGMSYQPPLIGGKQLLNFHATSLPGLGGIIMGLSILLGALAWWLSRPRSKGAVLPATNGTASASNILKTVASFVVLPMFLSLSSCSDKPEAINYDKDECAHCKMTISDKRFGAEIVTKKAKVYKFDAIECMCGFMLEKTVAEEDIATEWVVDYANPTTLIPARKAWYLKSDKVQSPMGMNLSAYSSKDSYENSQHANGGDLYYFDSVRLLVAKTW